MQLLKVVFLDYSSSMLAPYRVDVADIRNEYMIMMIILSCKPYEDRSSSQDAAFRITMDLKTEVTAFELRHSSL